MSEFPKVPKISIILPVYNRRHLILRAIKSVEAQSFQDWELLIVDDGSTDGLEELLLPQIHEKPKWRYMKHARKRLAASRNIGIHAAMGQFITFIDSDDEYRPNHLELRIRYFADHPDVDIIHGGVELVEPEKTHYVRDAFDPKKKIHISECCVGATFFGKRLAFLQSGGFKNLAYSAESEFLPRISKQVTVRKVKFKTYIYHTGLADSICTLRQNADR
ncbi:MAG: glycosyltransferase [Actinobacteria bacterium]|nr:glycosyltransferase [Actinomycetota bacterium]